MIEHCIALFKQKQEDKLLKVYITDGLKAITETLQSVYNGSALTTRWIELVDPPKQDTRTAEEIKTTILNKLKSIEGEEE